MGFVLEALRESQLRRNRLPNMRALSSLPRAREGVFPLGVCAGGGRLEWSPTLGDPPHLLWAGTTGSGKTRGMVALGLLALDWGWDVEVIDFKGGGDYWVLASLGAKVWITPEKSLESLQRASVDIRERNRAMWQTPMEIETEYGPKLDRAVNFADLDPSVREERGWKPRLVLIDETASIVTFKQPAKQKGDPVKPTGMEALRLATQLGRSAGVQLVLGMQRPDADLLEGFIKHNIQARILSGPADIEAERMVHGMLASTLDEELRLRPRPPGRGTASGFGPRPGVTLFQAYLLAKDRYLPSPADAAEPQSSSPSSEPDLDVLPPSSLASESSCRLASGEPNVSLSRSLVSRSAFYLRYVVGAIRLLFGPLRRGPFGRDPSLAVACRAAAVRCRACLYPYPAYEADHRRPLWAGGRDLPRNLWALCSRCHGAKTSAESGVRAAAKRLRRRPGFGWVRLRGYQWALLALFLLGLIDGWLPFLPGLLRVLLIGGFVVGVAWQFLRGDKLAGEDNMLGGDRKDERRAYRGTLAGAHVAAAQSFNVAKLRLRASLIWGGGAYVVGLVLALVL